MTVLIANSIAIIFHFHFSLFPLTFIAYSQEAVEQGIYKPIYVTVTTRENQQYTCRTYQMPRVKIVPPSPLYKKVIVTGASETGLPVEYIEQLRAIEDNGYDGTSQIQEHLGGL